MKGRNVTSVLQTVLIALFIAYGFQMAGPLRLNTDAKHFLSTAAEASNSDRAVPLAASRPHPPGYATLVAVLDRGGLAITPVLVGVNLAFLLAGLASARGYLKRGFGLSEEEALLVCAMTLLSFVMVKHAPIPISDVPFFGIAMTAVYVLVRAERASDGRGWWLALALLLIAAGIAVRTIGVALLPAALWVACGPRKRLATILLIAGSVTGAVVLFQTPYAKYAVAHFATGGGWGAIAAARLQELGELALNLPASRLPGALGSFVWVAGACLVLPLTAGVVAWRSGGTAEMVLIGFAGILLVWPFEDTRFWLPVVPLLITFAWLGLRSVPTSWAASWAGFHAVTGSAAIAFSTMVSLSADFPERYGDGTDSAAYRAAFGTPGELSDADQATLTLLQRFEPRARQGR